MLKPKKGPSAASIWRGVQDAWFDAALEQLAQMCGGFLKATGTPQTEPDVGDATPRLRININVSNAISYCDAILALSPSLDFAEGDVGPGASSSGSPTFKGVAFPQGSLEPLRLLKDDFMGPRSEFDVINTSNLADHFGE